MAVTFVVRLDFPFLVLFISQYGIHLSLHKLLEDIFEAFFEESIDIGYAVDVVL